MCIGRVANVDNSRGCKAIGGEVPRQIQTGLPPGCQERRGEQQRCRGDQQHSHRDVKAVACMRPSINDATMDDFSHKHTHEHNKGCRRQKRYARTGMWRERSAVDTGGQWSTMVVHGLFELQTEDTLKRERSRTPHRRMAGESYAGMAKHGIELAFDYEVFHGKTMECTDYYCAYITSGLRSSPRKADGDEVSKVKA